MKIIILGGAGFIGTNLALKLAEDKNNIITLVDSNKAFFSHINKKKIENINIREFDYRNITGYVELLKEQDVVYHLISTTMPTISNRNIVNEITDNMNITSFILDACVKSNIKKLVFLSSGGTVYGKDVKCPLSEDMETNPINSYGIQKLTIEKLLYLYNYLYNLDYCVVRLSNPYGPYQRPNGVLGVVTTFVYKVLKNERLIVYGDGTIVRDYIYIDDAINAIVKIANGTSEHRIFNVGCGKGISINEILQVIRQEMVQDFKVEYQNGRTVDVPVNYLDITRYESEYGKLNPISLNEGVRRTADFIKEYYNVLL